MKLFICIDDEGGISFMGRRVSRDRTVTADIAALAGDNLTVFPYSERLFKEAGYPVRVVSGDIDDTSALFIEDRGGREFIERADTVVLYRWNRLYPSDLKIDFSPCDEGFALSETVDFVGKSHEKITREIYTK